MLVKYIENGANEYFGKVSQPWYCCDRGLKIHDAQDKELYHIKGSCCQLGFCCKCPCESCQTINFEMLDANGTQVGIVQKVRIFLNLN